MLHLNPHASLGLMTDILMLFKSSHFNVPFYKHLIYGYFVLYPFNRLSQKKLLNYTYLGA